jgi:hypothetical protein
MQRYAQRRGAFNGSAQCYNRILCSMCTPVAVSSPAAPSPTSGPRITGTHISRYSGLSETICSVVHYSGEWRTRGTPTRGLQLRFWSWRACAPRVASLNSTRVYIQGLLRRSLDRTSPMRPYRGLARAVTAVQCNMSPTGLYLLRNKAGTPLAHIDLDQKKPRPTVTRYCRDGFLCLEMCDRRPAPDQKQDLWRRIDSGLDAGAVLASGLTPGVASAGSGATEKTWGESWLRARS